MKTESQIAGEKMEASRKLWQEYRAGEIDYFELEEALTALKEPEGFWSKLSWWFFGV